MPSGGDQLANDAGGSVGADDGDPPPGLLLPQPGTPVTGVNGADGPVGIREASRRLGITQPETRQIEARALERLAGLREIEALREAA